MPSRYPDLDWLADPRNTVEEFMGPPVPEYDPDGPSDLSGPASFNILFAHKREAGTRDETTYDPAAGAQDSPARAQLHIKADANKPFFVVEIRREGRPIRQYEVRLKHLENPGHPVKMQWVEATARTSDLAVRERLGERKCDWLREQWRLEGGVPLDSLRRRPNRPLADHVFVLTLRVAGGRDERVLGVGGGDMEERRAETFWGGGAQPEFFSVLLHDPYNLAGSTAMRLCDDAAEYQHWWEPGPSLSWWVESSTAA